MYLAFALVTRRIVPGKSLETGKVRPPSTIMYSQYDVVSRTLQYTSYTSTNNLSVYHSCRSRQEYRTTRQL